MTRPLGPLARTMTLPLSLSCSKYSPWAYSCPNYCPSTAPGPTPAPSTAPGPSPAPSTAPGPTPAPSTAPGPAPGPSPAPGPTPKPSGPPTPSAKPTGADNLTSAPTSQQGVGTSSSNTASRNEGLVYGLSIAGGLVLLLACCGAYVYFNRRSATSEDRKSVVIAPPISNPMQPEAGAGAGAGTAAAGVHATTPESLEEGGTTTHNALHASAVEADVGGSEDTGRPSRASHAKRGSLRDTIPDEDEAARPNRHLRDTPGHHSRRGRGA